MCMQFEIFLTFKIMKWYPILVSKKSNKLITKIILCGQKNEIKEYPLTENANTIIYRMHLHCMFSFFFFSFFLCPLHFGIWSVPWLCSHCTLRIQFSGCSVRTSHGCNASIYSKAKISFSPWTYFAYAYMVHLNSSTRTNDHFHG